MFWSFPSVYPSLSTFPYRSTETDVGDRDRNVLVELVPKCERQKMVSYVTERMSYAGYDLVELEKKEVVTDNYGLAAVDFFLPSSALSKNTASSVT